MAWRRKASRRRATACHECDFRAASPAADPLGHRRVATNLDGATPFVRKGRSPSPSLLPPTLLLPPRTGSQVTDARRAMALASDRDPAATRPIAPPRLPATAVFGFHGLLDRRARE